MVVGYKKIGNTQTWHLLLWNLSSRVGGGYGWTLDTPVCVDIAAAGASHEPPARIKAAALLAALPRDETAKCWQL